MESGRAGEWESWRTGEREISSPPLPRSPPPPLSPSQGGSPCEVRDQSRLARDAGVMEPAAVLLYMHRHRCRFDSRSAFAGAERQSGPRTGIAFAADCRRAGFVRLALE